MSLMFRWVRDFLYKHILLFIIFLTGAAILIIEVTATRLLSVYFGNTIYTFSSIISVILLALSFGYLMGGRLADRRGTEFLFFQIIAFGGLSIFLLHLLDLYIVPQISTQMSLQDGPLVSSLMLFLVPGILLGMLTPIVAKLQKSRQKKKGIGNITGEVFFASTVGSIVGSLGSGFYLIPTFGINEIIVFVGGFLFTVGIFGMLFPRRPGTSGGIVLVLLFTVPLLHITLISFDGIKENPNVLKRVQGLYDNIVIYNGSSFGTPARFLQQGTDATSAMYLKSDELVYDYTRYYQLYHLVTNTPESALVIGGGAYSVPKALLADDPHIKVDVAEVEPDLFSLSQQYFHVPNNNRLTNYVEDGRRLLREKETTYNLIFSDACHFSIPSHLATQEYFALGKSKLKPNGVFVANVIGNLHDKHSSFLMSEMKTFRTVFPNSYFFAVDSLDADQPQNIIMAGFTGDPGRNLLAVDTNDPFITTLPAKLIDLKKYNLDRYPLYTDDYAPVEYFISKSLTQ